MIDQALVTAIAAGIAPALPGVFIGKQHDARELALPAVLLTVESDAVLGSQLYRGTLTATVISASEDTSTEAHAALAALVDGAIREVEITSEDVELCGVVATSGSPDIEGKQFRTLMRYTVGFSAVI